MSFGWRYNLFKRKLRFLWQKLDRGWSDDEIWNLDISLAKLILPRLKRFKEIKGGYPGGMTLDKWEEILNQMIYAFEKSANRFEWDCDPEITKEVQKGLSLFAQYYGHLWT